MGNINLRSSFLMFYIPIYLSPVPYLSECNRPVLITQQPSVPEVPLKTSLAQTNIKLSTSCEGGVVAYPVVQAYGSLVLKDNLELGEVVFPASAPIPSSSQPKKHTHSWGFAGLIPGRTNCNRAWNGPGIPLHGFSAYP